MPRRARLDTPGTVILRLDILVIMATNGGCYGKKHISS